MQLKYLRNQLGILFVAFWLLFAIAAVFLVTPWVFKTAMFGNPAGATLKDMQIRVLVLFVITGAVPVVPQFWTKKIASRAK